MPVLPLTTTAASIAPQEARAMRQLALSEEQILILLRHPEDTISGFHFASE